MSSGVHRTILTFGILLCHAAAFAAPFGDRPDGGNASDAGGVPEADEVFLAFQYRGVQNTIVGAYHLGGEIYLPVIDLFSLLKINYTFDYETKAINGQYLNVERSFALDLLKKEIRLGETTHALEDEDFLSLELEYYIRAGVFEEVFGLRFQIDTSQLTLSLTTDDTLPVVEQLERRRRYSEIPELPWLRESYPLVYGRNRTALNGSFLDYTLSSSVSDRGNMVLYNLGLGAEVLGGDIQGFLIGSHSSYGSTFYTRDLRWRYVPGDNPLLRSISVGNLYSDGLVGRHFTGIRLSNEPLEPRVLYDDYIVEGTVEPDSEIELYFNNQLVDVQKADALGNYRFLVPLSYGTSQLRTMVYAPSGDVREVGRRIQIPYTFLPRGEISYDLSAGRLDGYAAMFEDEPMTVQSSVSVGLTGWLTARAGMDYFDRFNDGRPVLYSSVAGRIAGQYLVGVDVAPGALYRFSSNVTYPSAASWGIAYTHYDGAEVYNPSGRRREMRGSTFLPFSLLNVSMNLRVAGERYEYAAASMTGLRADFQIRYRRASFRLGYHDRFTRVEGLPLRSDGRISAVANYSLPRRRSTPAPLRGLLLRSQVEYGVHRAGIERVDLQASRSIGRNGRLYLRYENNRRRGTNLVEGGLAIDFNRVRATSTMRSSGSDYATMQTLRGSIGFDRANGLLVMDNRSQVGRAGASVRLFVDRNGSGTFDEGDELLPYDAVRIPRARSVSTVRDGILHVAQLEPYRRYNIEVLERGIKNPLLVPAVEQASFVADPNTFKPIDIPFYVTGILEGTVHQDRAGRVTPVSGLRVFVRDEDTGHTTTLRTYRDGTFYAMGVRPGRYAVYLDSLQLGLLGASHENTSYPVEILALPDGDFVDNLAFMLRAPDDQLADIGVPVPAAGTLHHHSAAGQPNVVLPVRHTGLNHIAIGRLLGAEREVLVMTESGKGGLSVAALVRKDTHSGTAHAGRAYPILDSAAERPDTLRHDAASRCMCASINGAAHSDLGYVILLGPFNSPAAAADAAGAAGRHFRTDAPIHYDAGAGDYFAYIEPIGRIGEARAMLARLQEQPGFETARVVSAYLLAGGGDGGNEVGSAEFIRPGR